MLCFGFRTKTMLITHQWFSCCWTVLYRAKDVYFFSFLYSPASEGRGDPKEMWGDRIRTSDLNWTKGYSIPYDITWKESLKKEGLHQADCCCSGTGWALVGRWWACALLVIYIYTYIYICHNYYPFFPLFLFSILLSSFHLNLRVLLCCFSFSPFSPSSHWEVGGVSKWLCGT